MPRYTQQQLREVLRRDSENEYLLFVDPRAEPGLILPEIRSASNVAMRRVPSELTSGVDDPSLVEARTTRFLDWVADQRVDLFHATTPFYVEQLVVSRFDACPMVATLYDLIPMIFPEHYFLAESDRRSYLRAAGLVASADRVLAISEAARTDGHQYLGIPPERIDVAWPIAEPFFAPLSESVVDTILESLAARVPVDGEMVMAVSHLHYTKNLETLLRAWALIPTAVRERFSLLLACHLDPSGVLRILDLAFSLGIRRSLVITGLVSDSELVALYNRARVVVHPSRYEGFGLPVLEAMQCGTPVITSTTSSLPEVGGEAALLVDPHDAPALAEAIETVAEDADLRAQMRLEGFEQARLFSGDNLARATLASYALAVDGGGAPRSAGSKEVLRPARRSTPRLAGAAAGGDWEQPPMKLNKLCELEDLSDPGLSKLLRECSAATDDQRGQWEMAMAVSTLERFGLLREDARVLGARAGDSGVVFYLAGRVGQIFAVDDYVSGGHVSPMLLDPSTLSPYPFDSHRLVVQHSSGRVLLSFPDGTFDAVVAPPGAVADRSDLMEVAAAVYEMGRVLRPGGILSLIATVAISGARRAGALGPSVRLTLDDVSRYVSEASGLEPVDELSRDLSPATLATPRDFSHASGRASGGTGTSGASSQERRAPGAGQPALLAVRGGDVVASLHLALRKTERYPWPDNEWARPSPPTPSVSHVGSAGTAGDAVHADGPQPEAADDVLAPADRDSGVAAATRRRLTSMRQRQAEVPKVLENLRLWQEGVDEVLGATRKVRQGAEAYAARLAEMAGEVDSGVGTRRSGRASGSPPEPEGLWQELDVGDGRRVSLLSSGPPGETVPVSSASNHAAVAARLLFRMVGPGDVLVDVASGDGWSTMGAAAAGAAVVAVEASVPQAARLRASVVRSGLEGVRVVHASVVAPDETFSTDGWEPQRLTVTLLELLAELDQLKVSVVRLGGSNGRLPSVRTIAVLLERSPGLRVLMDPHEGGSGLRELVCDLEGKGYRSYRVEPSRLIPVATDDSGDAYPMLATRVPPVIEGWPLVEQPG